MLAVEMGDAAQACRGAGGSPQEPAARGIQHSAGDGGTNVYLATGGGCDVAARVGDVIGEIQIAAAGRVDQARIGDPAAGVEVERLTPRNIGADGSPGVVGESQTTAISEVPISLDGVGWRW